MKKHVIYGITAVAALAVTAGQPMTAMAANWAYTNSGNIQYKIVTGDKQGINIRELLGGLKIDCDTPNQPVNPDQPDDSGSQEVWARQIVDLVNVERAKAGAAALTVSSGASRAAQVRAEEITKSFSHTRPDGRSFSTALTEVGVMYGGSGENIAYGQRSPQAVMDQWMSSAGHRANILNPDFTAIGVGHYESGNGTDYWTQLFIR